LIYIASGEFLIGSDDPKLKKACQPQHRVDVGPFCIARFPVTNADYQRFIDNNPNYPVPFSPMRFAERYNWDRRSRTYPRRREEHPVVLVTWADALAYCHWLSEVSGYLCRLSTEAEWEKDAAWDAAAGRARRYPWGDNFDESRCNVDAHGALRVDTSPLEQFAEELHPEQRPEPVEGLVKGGDSPYGLSDCAGNV